MPLDEITGELMEQLMRIMYIEESERDTITGILKVGGHIGRTCYVIVRLLRSRLKSLVVIEQNKSFREIDQEP